MIVFSTAGKPDSFGKRKFPHELPAYLAEFGLNGFEIQCGRGINISQEAYNFFSANSQNEQNKLRLSLHTPYFISLSSVEEEKRVKSIRYILESAQAAHKIGAERIIVHSGSCAKISREQALELALDTLKKAREEMDSAGLEHIKICPETMGKIKQLGTLEEVLELCEFDNRMIPCIDFGHLNARTHGEINANSTACYRSILDKVKDKIGIERLKNLHIHFSKIEYSAGGEKKHLTFADTQFGPDYKPLIDEIIVRDMQPFIVCESSGTQAEDCAEMKDYYNSKRSVNHD